MVPLLKFTVARLALFVAALLAMIVVGARGVLALGLAMVISLALSYVLLRGPRDALALALHERLQRRLDGPQSRFARRLAQDAEAEDVAVEDAAGITG